MSIVVLAACSTPDLPLSDAGWVDTGVTVTVPPPPCERASDCDNGRFCDGVERCEPGAPGADRRGCVAGTSPCTESCNEEEDRCGECVDRDGDGELPLACGGSDCDDTDPNRYGGNIEICDPEHHDEDCVRSTVGPDIDRDGHQDPRCCAMWEGELVCGTDCDDGDPTINPERDEICNGRDDDCDGTIDEGFDCPADRGVAGTNACGHEGVRQCAADCRWVDDDYYVPESRSTCDYCADSAAGIYEELPFADLFHAISFPGVHGDADSLYLAYEGMEGSRSTRAYELGYDGVSLDMNVDVSARNADPDGAWAVGVFPYDPAAPTFERGGPFFGVPSTRPGVVLVWDFAGPAVDRLSWYRISPGMSPVLIDSMDAYPEHSLDDAAAGWVRQTISLGVAADPPGPSDSTVIRLGGGREGSYAASSWCCNRPSLCPSGESCGITLPLGGDVQVIVGAATDDVLVIWRGSNGGTDGLCPP